MTVKEKVRLIERITRVLVGMVLALLNAQAMPVIAVNPVCLAIYWKNYFFGLFRPSTKKLFFCKISIASSLGVRQWRLLQKKSLSIPTT